MNREACIWEAMMIESFSVLLCVSYEPMCVCIHAMNHGENMVRGQEFACTLDYLSSYTSY